MKTGACMIAVGLAFATAALAQTPKKKGISVGEPPADHSPEAELASFKVLEGFEVNLFASEKDGVANPLVIRWDERGRLWVISTTAYPQPAPDEVCDDKILILEDTDHDGRMDKKTVFADGLRMPMGMELAAPGELYVGEGEKLWLFKDTNGDDRVDEKEVIFSGFGTGDTHQNINSFIWSPDGALVMHQGLHCYSRVTTPWGVKQLYGSGFWRFWPRSRKLEAYPTGMPANAWGTAFTKWGQPIMVAGAAGMYWARPMEISVPEILTENPQPYFLLTRFMLPHSGQIIKTEGLRKFCGVDIVGNTHWPEAMQEEIVAGGFFENAVYRYKLIDDSANPSGFEAIEQPPLITSDSVAFRPVDIRFGPEGALYVADWYDPIIGHYQASFRHPNRDKAHGRIWRVVAKGRPKAPSTGSWLAYQAQRQAAMQNSEEPTADILASVNHSDESVRASAVHSLGTWADKVPDALSRIESSIADESPRVRLEAIVACAKVKHPDAIKVALQALDKPMDTFLDRALWLAVHATAPQWKGQMVSPSGGVEFLNALPADHLAYLVEKEGSKELLDSVRRMVAERSETLAPETLRGLLSALVKTGDSADVLNALKLGQKDALLLHDVAGAAQRGGKAPPGSEEIVRQLLQSGNPEQRASACRMAGAWRMKNLTELILQQTQKEVAVRSAALRALGKLGAAPDLLERVMDDAKETWSVRTAALEALTEMHPLRAVGYSAKALSAIPDTETMRAWLAPLLTREVTISALAKSIETTPCSADAAKLALSTLTAAGRSDAALTAAFSKIMGVKNTVPAYDSTWVNALAAEVKSQGDAAAGQAVFRAPLSGCVACHQIGKQGGTIGPELDSVGRGVPVELLIEAVVWPNRQIKEGYVATTLALHDGRKLQGYKVSEANGELHLRDFLTGTVSRFPGSQIKGRQEAGSLMPEGLIMNMTRTELRDLIAYLAGLGKQP